MNPNFRILKGSKIPVCICGMVFDIDEIPEDGLSFEVLEKRDRFGIDQTDCFLCKDVGVRGTLRKVEKDVYFTGQVDSEVSTLCSRCLEPTRLPIDSKVTARFVLRDDSKDVPAEAELHLEDIDVEYYQGHKVDLTQSVRDHIMLALPAICVCREDCLGLCPNCGKNINMGHCDCKDTSGVDPRLEVLKTLKDKLK